VSSECERSGGAFTIKREKNPLCAKISWVRVNGDATWHLESSEGFGGWRRKYMGEI